MKNKYREPTEKELDNANKVRQEVERHMNNFFPFYAMSKEKTHLNLH